MYIVTKGDNRISLPEKEDATSLIYSLTVMGCSEPIKTQQIIGNKEEPELFEVCFLDKAVTVINQADAEQVLSWMLSLGCKKVSIERLVADEGTEK